MLFLACLGICYHVASLVDSCVKLQTAYLFPYVVLVFKIRTEENSFGNLTW